MNVDVAADQAGVLGKISRQEGETVHPGDVLGVLDDAAQPSSKTIAPPAESRPTSAADSRPTSLSETPSATEMDRPHASPVARRLAEEHGVDLGTVEGTGTGGRVTREDVERHLGTPPPAERPASTGRWPSASSRAIRAR